jgi:hypothetical protein
MEQTTHTPRNAKFVVKTIEGKLVKEYNVLYESSKDLNTKFHEARKVWAEYFVEAITDTFTIGFSHTYIDELNFGKIG